MKRDFLRFLVYVICVCLMQFSLAAQMLSSGCIAAGNRVSKTIELLQPSPLDEDEDAFERNPQAYTEMLSDTELKLFPNPFESRLFVEIKASTAESCSSELYQLCLADSVIGQIEENKDTVLQGVLGPQILTMFPLANDSTMKENKHPVIYPLLIVNNVPIEDPQKVDCFRNHFDRTKIVKIKCISKEQAERKGIRNVPPDGVLLVATKKDYCFDFSCE